MARPQIRPPIFVALQNGMASALFASLLLMDLLRRLLHAHPDSPTLWWLSVQANRSLMPVMRFLDTYISTPERLLAVLVAGIVIPLLAWRTRYWLATAFAGHVTLAALVIITNSLLRKETMPMPSPTLSGILAVLKPSLPGFLLLGLSLFVLAMCVADHVAFFRFLAGLFRRRGSRGPGTSGDLRTP